MSEGCSVRIPDNSDFISCGKPVIFGGLCAEHARRRLRVVENELKETRLKLHQLTRERELLDAKLDEHVFGRLERSGRL
jgi:hypothetical protein